MSKKEVARVFDETKVAKLIDQFNANVNSAVKNVTKNCVLLANASEGDFTEVKNRLVEKQGLSGGAISQMRGAGKLYKEIKSINDISYTKVYEIARFDKAITKLPAEKASEAYISLIGYVESANANDLPTDYNDDKEAILRSGISNKELKIAVDCALEDCGLKKIKAIEKNAGENAGENAGKNTGENAGENAGDNTIDAEMLVYQSFINLGDSEKIAFLKLLKDEKYIDRISSNWK